MTEIEIGEEVRRSGWVSRKRGRETESQMWQVGVETRIFHNAII